VTADPPLSVPYNILLPTLILKGYRMRVGSSIL
jgi:hypothetical protein